MNSGKWHRGAVVEKPIKQTFGISLSERHCLDTGSAEWSRSKINCLLSAIGKSPANSGLSTGAYKFPYGIASISAYKFCFGTAPQNP